MENGHFCHGYIELWLLMNLFTFNSVLIYGEDIIENQMSKLW